MARQDHDARAVGKATEVVPTVMQVLLLYLEPLFAIAGVVLVFVDPKTYVTNTTRNMMSSIDPTSNFIYTQIAAGWLHFIFTEAVVLRLVDDLRVWRLLFIGMLLSDLTYTLSLAQAVGGWGVWVDLTQWTTEDWFATLGTLPFLITRVMILFGIGLEGSGEMQAAKQK